MAAALGISPLNGEPYKERAYREFLSAGACHTIALALACEEWQIANDTGPASHPMVMALAVALAEMMAAQDHADSMESTP